MKKHSKSIDLRIQDILNCIVKDEGERARVEFLAVMEVLSLQVEPEHLKVIQTLARGYADVVKKSGNTKT
jgi:hypothetical protein